MADILVYGLTQNNLKHVTFRIPKEKITVFTGVSGSGKSSIVFDTIAAESQRQMNAAYPAFVRSRLPKYPKPAAERIDNLTASVVVDQSPLGGNARSTVGTISGLYASLRLLFSRIGKPYAGTASYFSFNDPTGCAGPAPAWERLQRSMWKLFWIWINHGMRLCQGLPLPPRILVLETVRPVRSFRFRQADQSVFR